MKDPATGGGQIGAPAPWRAWLRQGRVKRLLDGPRAVVRVGRNIVRWALRRSDINRWSAPDGLEAWWEERTRLIGQLVPPGARVIEFGAGRRHLERHLPKDCTYTPSDLVDRGPGTIVCDLNHRPLPDLGHLSLTTAVFGGVLEYIKDVPSLVNWLGSTKIRTFVVSFDAVPARLGLTRRLRERLRRSYYGYMNNLTEQQLLRCFADAHLVCAEQRRWMAQGIYRFEREH